ncbi:unnamed protein product [Cuscuta campestris]|uniref:Uncharacterized protein n=1 Tax=Cuscuta campestris TaxID=132261 RepID=A0A484KAJ6_9ASTE|nr:unnamed protein product [Cuscuta campestris]
MVYDDISNIDVSSDIEGLKEALAGRYKNDPNRDYNYICEEIERNKSYFEEKVGPFSASVIPKRITRLGVFWIGKSLTLSCLDFSY